MATDVAPTGAADEFDADEFDADYRSLSGSAVVALLVGLLSPVALLAPMLVVVPLVAIAVAAVALRSLAANREVLTGRPLALTGLALAVASLAMTTTRDAVRHRLLSAQAEQAARVWIEQTVAGQLDSSYLMTLDRGRRAMATNPAVAESDEAVVEIAKAKAAYAERDTVQQLAALDGDVTVERTSNGELRRVDSRRMQLLQDYRVDDASGARVDLTLLLERTAGSKGPATWRIADYGPVDQ